MFLTICPEMPPLIKFLVSLRTRKEPGRNNSYLSLPYRLSLAWGWAKADQNYESKLKNTKMLVLQEVVCSGMQGTS